MSFVQQLVGWISGAITNALNEFWSWVTGALAAIFDKVKEVISGMVKWVWENAASAFNTIIVQPLASGLRAAAAYVMQKLKGTLYIAIVVPLMLREVRGIIEWRSPRDIGLGIAKLLLKPVVARLGVELFWALLPSVLPAPTALQPPAAQPVPPAPPAFTAPPPASKVAQLAWTDAVAAAAAAAVAAGMVQELSDAVAASSAGAVVGPAALSLSDSVAAASSGSVSGPSTASLSDSIGAAATGSIAQYYAGANLSDSVSASAALGNSSRIDPFRPPWLYQYASTAIKRLYWDFYSSGEVTSFFTSTAKPSWYDNYAYFDSVTAYREDARYTHAVVACFRPLVTAVEGETQVIYVAIDDGATALRGAYVTVVNALTLRLYDRGGLSYQQFSWGGDWLVLYVSHPEKVARIYDRNGNLLASIALQDYLPGTTAKYTVTGSSPSINIRLAIDWVTVSTP
ncbi:MAG: hypothetical protein LM580_10315 [Thermofilum sp.]|nr:hypothetical protein [Thermofilum sp.]